MGRGESGRIRLGSLVLAVLLAAGGWHLWQTNPELVKSLSEKVWSQVKSKPILDPNLARPRTTAKSGEVEAKIYYLHVIDGKQRIEGLARKLPAERPAKAALEALLAQERPEGYERPLPAGTKLLSVKRDGEVVTADFSRELAANFRGGSDNEYIVVYSIVNTLASLPGVEKTQILVEGKRIDSLGGHLDTSVPLAYDSELVASAKR